MGKEKQCNKKNCTTCQFYKEDGSCSVTGEKECNTKTQFSKCNDYLVSEKLVHF